MQKKTKIVATIGPKSEDVQILQSLFKAGVNVCRQNFSHGDHKEHEKRFKNIKQASKRANINVATLQDLSGPKIRTGENKDSEFIKINKGDKLFLTSKKLKNTNDTIHISYPPLAKELKKGHRVLLNDGKLTLVVEKKVDDETILATALNSASLRSRRGVNFPDSDISVSSLTAKDKKDLKFALEKLDFDYIALSFVRSKKDIDDLRKILNKHKSQAKIVAKIETPQAVRNIDEILSVSDAVMIARGDLAVEIGAQKVPMVQKTITKKANELGKTVIVATQMLETMIHEPVPTRAEVSDISNAILDGADAVMLSEETAMGKYPLEAVSVMSAVCQETEAYINYKKRILRGVQGEGRQDKTDIVTRHAAKIAHDIGAKAIVAFTETGTTAKMISRFRPAQDIFVISPSEKVLRQMQLVFGARPGKKADLSRKRDVLKLAENFLLKEKVVRKGDYVVVVSGSIFGKPGETNTITVLQVGQ